MNKNQQQQIANKSHQNNATNSSNASGTHSASSIFDLNSIKNIGESIGIGNISDEGCRELTSDLSFTLNSLLRDAQKFARRSRRNNIIPSDIDYALKVRLIEPIYGFHSSDPTPFKCTTLPGGSGSGRSIYYNEEQIIDLNDVISINNKTIKLPNDFVINAHWLAIDGVQPSVPENPQLLSRELQKKEAIEGVLSKSKDKLQSQHQQKRNINESVVKLKSLLPHDLSMEQQIYFKEITEACVGSDEQKRTEALNSLSTDPGLHQLLPRFIVFISEGVRLNITQFNMAILIYLMRIAKSLIDNKSIYLEKYLHELLPSILSCQLSKQICARPDQDNHFALREFCARLIGQIVKTYTSTMTQLQSRIIKIYLKSMQSDKTNFSTLFGAIVGFAELGNEICESFIFPLIKPLGERITQILDSPATSQEKLPAEKIKNQITQMALNVLAEKPPQSSDEFDFLTTEFGAYFGQLIHSQLMKTRSQRISSNHAQIAAAAAQNPNSKTIIANSKLNNSLPKQQSINSNIPEQNQYMYSDQPKSVKSDDISLKENIDNNSNPNRTVLSDNDDKNSNMESNNLSDSSMTEVKNDMNFDEKLIDQSADDLFF